MSCRLAVSLAEATLDAGEAAINAAVTVSARMPILVQHLVAPNAEGLAEWTTAVGEKMSAAWDGALDAASVWNTALVNACWTVPTPLGMAQDTLAMMRAGANPALVCVRANADRLTTRRS